MKNCRVCGAALIKTKEETPLGTAIRFVCSRYSVHPRAFFVLGGKGAIGAPAAGVPR